MVKTDEPIVVFEDADLLVVNKPGTMACHSSDRPTLAGWLRARGLETPRLIHRLDRETSGLVLVAKHERAARSLGRQALRREIEKEYVAICWGRMDSDAGRIEQPIAVRPTGPVFIRRVVDPAGKPSVTEYAVEQRLAGFTVVRLRPRTGRAHQLRVHLSWLGHPVVGDKIYGPQERWYLEFIERGVTGEMLQQLLLPRQALHAARVTLRYPPLRFEAPLPDDMRTFIEERR